MRELDIDLENAVLSVKWEVLNDDFDYEYQGLSGTNKGRVAQIKNWTLTVFFDNEELDITKFLNPHFREMYEERAQSAIDQILFNDNK